MFGISIYEFLVIIFILVAIFKPRDMITFASSIAVFFKDFRKLSNSIKEDFEKVDVINNNFDDYIISENKPLNKEIDKE